MQPRCIIGMLTLDVKKAHNCTQWHLIATSLLDNGVPRYICSLFDSYLDGTLWRRSLRYYESGTHMIKDVIAGISQGLV